MQQQIDIKNINKKQRKWRGLYWVSVVPVLAIGITYASAYAYAIGKKDEFSALNYYSDHFNSRELLYYEGNKSLQVNKNIGDFYEKVTTDWGHDITFFTDIENAVSILDDFGINPDPLEAETRETETTEVLEWRELKRQIAHAALTFDQLMKSAENIDDIKYWIELSKDLQKNMKFITYSMPATSISFNGKTFLEPTIPNWTIGRWLNELNYHWERTTWTKYEKMPEILDAFENIATLNLTENNEAKDLIIAYMFYLMSITSPSNKKPVFSSVIKDDEYAFETFPDNTTLSFTKSLPRMFNELSSIDKSMIDYQTEIKSVLEFEKNPIGSFHTLSKLDIFTINSVSRNDFSDFFVKISDLTIEIQDKIKEWKTTNPLGKLERISFNGEMIISDYDMLLTSNVSQWNNSVSFHTNPTGTPQNKFTDIEDEGYRFYKQLFPSANNINKNYGHYLIFSSLLETFAFDLKYGEKNYIESHSLNGDTYYGGDLKVSNSVFNENMAPGLTRAFPMDITNTTYGEELIYTREYITARTAAEMEQRLLGLKSNLRKYKPSSSAWHVSDYYLVDPIIKNKIIEFNKMTVSTDVSSIVSSFQGSSFDMHDPRAGAHSSASVVQDDIVNLINSPSQVDKKDIYLTDTSSTRRYQWFQLKPSDCSDAQWDGSNYYAYDGRGTYTKLKSTMEIDEQYNLLGRNSFSFKNSDGELFVFGSPDYFNRWIEREYEANLFNTNSTSYSVYKSVTNTNEPTIIAKAYDKTPVSYVPTASEYLSDVTQTSHLIMNNDRIVIDTKPYELRYSFRTNKYIPTLP